MLKNARILVTGSTGMVGGAVARKLISDGYTAVLTPVRSELDCADARSVRNWFADQRPDHVLMIAARVGGIAANVADPVGFAVENSHIALNLFGAAHEFGAKKNLFLGSSCIYPRDCQQPMHESSFMTGPLEPTNESYAMAKLLGLRLAKSYDEQHGMVTICPVPPNLYGTGDHFDFKRAHVLSALVRRFVEAEANQAPEVLVWGTGSASREFMHVDDLANAIVFLMTRLDQTTTINVGSGDEVTIKILAEMIASATGYQGRLNWDLTKPDGMPRKCMDVSHMKKVGFAPEITLQQGIVQTIREFRELAASGAAL